MASPPRNLRRVGCPVRVVTVVVLVWLLVGSASASGAAPGPLVRKDAQASQEVLAFSRWETLRTSRIRSDTGDGRQMPMGFVNPGRTRMVVGPLRLHVRTEAGQVQVTMDCADFDAPIQIELPACQHR